MENSHANIIRRLERETQEAQSQIRRSHIDSELSLVLEGFENGVDNLSRVLELDVDDLRQLDEYEIVRNSIEAYHEAVKREHDKHYGRAQ